MEEKNRHILEKAFEQLPAFKADARIWDKIEQQLDKEGCEKNPETLTHALSQMISFRADENIWNKIEKELDSESNTATKFYFLKIAASVIIISGVSIGVSRMFTKNTPPEQITFSQEKIPDNESDVYSAELEKELTDLIRQQCLIQPDICKNPVFTELNEELSGLTKSLDEIKMFSKNSDNDPEIYKYILRIQKERAEISKKLLHFFNS